MGYFLTLFASERLLCVQNPILDHFPNVAVGDTLVGFLEGAEVFLFGGYFRSGKHGKVYITSQKWGSLTQPLAEMLPLLSTTLQKS